MGAPSACSVSMPVTRVAGESGALRSVVPCAAQPAEAGEISNSSWPTVWPSSWMVNFPLSAAKTAALFCACETRELHARMHAVRTPNVIVDFKDLRIIELLLNVAATKACHSNDAKHEYPARLRSLCYPRLPFRKRCKGAEISGFRLFDHEVSIPGASGSNSSAQNFGNHAGWFSGTVYAVVGLLIGRQALRVKGAKAGLVAKQRTAAHGHAARQQDIKGGVQPDDGNAGRAKKLRRASLGVGSAAKREDHEFLVFEGAAER